ncbi:MAG: hypothetical protein AAF383_07290 [Cyanobacteria bacterium P01_A01_bin.83]
MISQAIKRFFCGAAVGLFIATIFWSYSAFFYVATSVTQGIVGTILLALGCGTIATIGSIDKLMDNLNFPM